MSAFLGHSGGRFQRLPLAELYAHPIGESIGPGLRLGSKPPREAGPLSRRRVAFHCARWRSRRPRVIRLKVNTGSWTMEPIDGGKRTLATYQLLTDPGGSIPTFIANKANTKALPELFSRVRKRAEAKQ